jgi:hypothetical protein
MEENDFVYVRFRMKKTKFAVFQTEADEINEKYNTNETGTSRIKALADDIASDKLNELTSPQQPARQLTAYEQMELNGF